MKPVTPHDPLDDLIAAALHGELTPEERTQFDTRLSNDPAARAAYQEARLMHDMLEKNYKNAQPDPAFEQRMVSGVRRKIHDKDQSRETPWQSVLVLLRAINKLFRRRHLWQYATSFALFTVVALSFLIMAGNQVKSVFTTISSQLAYAGSAGGSSYDNARRDAIADAKASIDADNAKRVANRSGYVTTLSGANTFNGGTTMSAGQLTLRAGSGTVVMNGATPSYGMSAAQPAPATTPPMGRPFPQHAQALQALAMAQQDVAQAQPQKALSPEAPAAEAAASTDAGASPGAQPDSLADIQQKVTGAPSATTDGTKKAETQNQHAPAEAATPALDTRKLIRNAQLELEVKSFPSAMDQITALTKTAGGYVDTSNAQKGGNGKLQGTVVVKVLPQNLDDFLLKLRDLGQIANQSVSTEDVTKDYFDTQARLENSRRMETQLQDLLKHENSKVSDLLQVERELGRVRGDIEQMQGTLKVYDFQVAYATVTMQVREKGLNQAAAYLLKEQDEFSLFATDVEVTFQKARQAADDFKAQVLVANLNHNSGSDVSAELTVMVAPDQIEPFLSQIRSLGRVANFTRQTQRVAKDGGDSDQPADETLTDKDKVQVHLAIRSDDETRKQVALTVVTPTVDTALDSAKAAALASAGTEILNSSLNKTPEGQSTAQLSVRVPGKDYSALLEAFHALGRTASLSIQRNDDSGPGANGDDAPVIVSLALTDDETPLQTTEMAVVATDVDGQAQQLKKDAASAGVQVKASSFERQPDGTETAEMTFRLPMVKYPVFVETLKKLGKVESLTVHRDDRPDQTRTDETAPAEISLQMHNQADIVPDNTGLWTTLRQTFGEGAGALFGSVKAIGVIVAFLVPWVFTIGLLAWAGRRIYLWRQK